VAENSRLTVAVHALCWLALAGRSGVDSLTSEQIASSLESNPVAVRRALAPLRDAGMVTTDLGRQGGWSLARPAERITLAEVHAVVDGPQVFALHPHEPNQECPVGFGIRDVLDDVYGGVAAAVDSELARHTVADVLDTLLRDHPLPQPWAGVPGVRRAGP
jgi:DNA-binding IscR family transcriptional regulator